MGLLDDAIRDHLELKRLRGADPGEVAREQREALEPDLREGSAAGEEELATAVEEQDPENSGESLPARATQSATSTSIAEPVRAPVPSHSESSATVAEETAELDMSSVLDEDETIEDHSGDRAFAADSLAGSPSFDDLNEDQLQWEVPGDSSAGMPPDAGQDDLAADEDGR